MNPMFVAAFIVKPFSSFSTNPLLRVSLDFDKLFVLIEGQLRTAYRTELAYGGAAFRFAQPRALMNRTIAQNVIHVSHGQVLSFLKRWTT